MAYVLNGSRVQFDAAWDGAANMISLTSGKAYTPDGSEMKAKGAANKVPVLNKSKIMLNGKEAVFNFTIPDGVTEITYGGSWGAYLVYPDNKSVSLDTLLKESGYISGMLLSITIPGSVERVGDKQVSGEGAFTRYSKLKSVTILEGVKEIGPQAFKSCRNLESVVLPNSVTKIGEYAFSYTSLKEIKLPSSLKIIGNGAFELTKIKTAVVPDGTIKIGNGAFINCNELTDLTIPSSVVELTNMFRVMEMLVFTILDKIKHSALSVFFCVFHTMLVFLLFLICILLQFDAFYKTNVQSTLCKIK